MKSFKEWTLLEVQMHNSRVSKPNQIPVPADACEDESKLHDEIRAECRRRGWMVVHSRMDRATTVAVGVPDFVIAADSGVTFWVEAKAKRKKMTLEQLACAAQLNKLGHRFFCVWNYQQFLDCIALTK